MLFGPDIVGMDVFIRELAYVAGRVRRFYPHPPEWSETLYLSAANRSLYKAAFDNARTNVWGMRWEVMPLEMTRKEAGTVMEKFHTSIVWSLYSAIKDGYEPELPPGAESDTVVSKDFRPRENENDRAPTANENEEETAEPVAAAEQAQPHAGGAQQAQAQTQAPVPTTGEGVSVCVDKDVASDMLERMRTVPVDVFRVLRLALMADAYLAFSVLYLEAEQPSGYDYCKSYLARKARFMRVVFPGICSATVDMVNQRDVVELQRQLLGFAA